jgi:hypothetical protein
MRAIRLCLSSVLLASAACGGGSNTEPDAAKIFLDAPIDAPPPDAFEPTFDFTCMGNTQGAAAANVTLSGFAAEVVIAGMAPDIQPSHGAKVDFCKASSTTCTNADLLDTMDTPANGCPATGCPFTSDALATAGTPLDLYSKISKAGVRTTYIYPSAPVIADVMNIPGVMFTPGVLAALAFVGIDQMDGNGILMIAITDCANMPISDTANTTIVLKQGGQVVQGTQQFDLSQADPALAGTYAIFNVPAGTMAEGSLVTEVSGMYKTKALRTHDVRAFRDATTATQLRPGF